jgi:16S rRNA (cytosine967-C5)-methyltransferase
MRPGARVAAAIEVLADIAKHHRTAALALADWGRTHRFAGAGDRAAIGNLVFDALRRRASAAWLMENDTPRALVLGALRLAWQIEPAEIAALFDGSPHAPPPLDPTEADRLAGLAEARMAAAPDWVRADIPEWLAEPLRAAFGDRLVAEGEALAARAPVDLRVNTLKTSRDKLVAALAHLGATPTRLSPLGVRIPPPDKAGRSPNVEAEPAHGRGHFEVQDEGSQIAALLAAAPIDDARAGPLQIADICAGAGGKTLALAALTANKGQIYAYDSDRTRLRPIFERLKRAGTRNVQVVEPGRPEHLAPLAGRMDVVLVDAPCTGSGVWRRRPDAKWRLKPAQLAERLVEQREVLEMAARLVSPGGRLVYVTCSLLPAENEEQLATFCAAHGDLSAVDYRRAWQRGIGTEPPSSATTGTASHLLLTPAQHGTDGFFVSILERRK